MPKSFLLPISFIYCPKVWSCSVCFGGSESDQVQAMKWGILFLMGIVLGVLGGCVAFCIQMNQRIKNQNILRNI